MKASSFGLEGNDEQGKKLHRICLEMHTRVLQKDSCMLHKATKFYVLVLYTSLVFPEHCYCPDNLLH